MKNKYIQQLQKTYRTKEEVKSEMLNLKTILLLPKATEFFLSDLHGEYESFLHLLKSGSGVIKNKIDLCFEGRMDETQREALAHLIYYPERHLEGCTLDWYVEHVMLIMELINHVSRKYTRSKVNKKMPESYRYVINEMMRFHTRDMFEEMVAMLIEINDIERFMISLCTFVQNLCVDHIHIIGDFFDRGPRPDYILDALMKYPEVDIQWGNHDISWMGAACGNMALIANVVRISLSYNNLDVLEDGYGINLRALSDFARETYRDDPCTCFIPHVFDENRYDQVNVSLMAKMHKAMTIIQLKLVGQLLARHPEYVCNYTDYLSQLDQLSLRDDRFPTVDLNDPYILTAGETQLMKTLQYSFLHSVSLQRHIQYLYSHGSMYKVYNGNLLYHGCVPLDAQGLCRYVTIDGQIVKGKELFDVCESIARRAYYSKDPDCIDFMWYLWCGPDSPLYGKKQHLVFENYFLEGHFVEERDAYYDYIDDEATCQRILDAFHATGRIINGHVPVIVKHGETPVKANGKALIIDGGLSKPYYEKTGSSGYTLIFDSEHLYLAKHAMFSKDVKTSFMTFTPEMQIIDSFTTIKNYQTDLGQTLEERIADLEQLLDYYAQGILF